MATLSRRVLKQQKAEADDPRCVRVILRVRPLKPNEDGRCVELGANNTVVLNEITENSFGRVSQNRHEFRLDGCYGEASTQEEIFNTEVKPSLERALNRHNTTIFTYGITGSGKTFTMVGTGEQPGIIPRSFEYLFQRKDEIEEQSKMETRMNYTMQFYEIIKDRIYDLIECNAKELPLREAGDREVVVCNLSETHVVGLESFDTLFQTGCRNRTTKSTSLNETSSRSHAVVVIRAYMFSKASNTETLLSKINLIDLAGSEDNRQTGNTGDRLNESNAINLSLFALGNCISALNAKKKRIPFRESKLTRVLSDSLGGTSSSTLICTIPPSASDFASTFTTLSFAVKSRNIQNSVSTSDVTGRGLNAPECQFGEKTCSDVSVGSDPANKTLWENTTSTLSCSDNKQKLGSVATSMKLSSDKENMNDLESSRKRNNACMEHQTQNAESERGMPFSNAEAYIQMKKTALASDFVKKAKEFSDQGLDYDALNLYREASQLKPENDKIRAKVDEFNLKCRTSLKKTDSNIDSLLSPVKTVIVESPVETDFNEQKFVETLNTGSMKDLCSYNMIGKAIAAKIIELRQTKTFEAVVDLKSIGKINDKWIENFLLHNKK